MSSRGVSAAAMGWFRPHQVGWDIDCQDFELGFGVDRLQEFACDTIVDLFGHAHFYREAEDGLESCRSQFEPKPWGERTDDDRTEALLHPMSQLSEVIPEILKGCIDGGQQPMFDHVVVTIGGQRERGFAPDEIRTGNLAEE